MCGPSVLGVCFDGGWTDSADLAQRRFGRNAAFHHKAQDGHARSALATHTVREDFAPLIEDFMGAFCGLWPILRGFAVGGAKIFDGQVQPVCACLGQANGQVGGVFVCEFGGGGHSEDEVRGPFQKRDEIGVELPAAPRHGGNRKCAARKGDGVYGKIGHDVWCFEKPKKDVYFKKPENAKRGKVFVIQLFRETL